nr:LEAF RUST 10 DISEASE-RESISTANCE LOCUS RECEPTOR-LIKE PROTEIN KINASE-like 2.1 [Ipomoea batatas]
MSLHPQNASLDFNLFNYVPSGDQNITLFYGCTLVKPDLNCSEPNFSFGCNNNENRSLGPPLFDPTSDNFNCTLFKDSSFGVYGLGTSPRIGSFLDNVRCGGIQIVVTVTQGAFEALANASHASEELLRSSMAGGFSVEWKANNSLCQECLRSGGRYGSNGNLISTQFVCYCANRTFSSTCTSIRTHTNSDNNNESKKGLSIGVKLALVAMFGLLGVVLTSMLIICFFKKRGSWRKGDKRKENIKEFIRTNEFHAIKLYTHSDIKKMTNSFNNKIGEGGFGSVYRGKLPDGCPVAVKLLTNTKGNGEDFINEVSSCWKIHS